MFQHRSNYQIIFFYIFAIIAIVIPLRAAQEDAVVAESEIRSVKKELSAAKNRDDTSLNISTARNTFDKDAVIVPHAADEIEPPLPVPSHEDTSSSKNKFWAKKLDNLYDLPSSFRLGFYLIMGSGVLAIFFFTYRSFKLRLSRAERRYGVTGDRTTQELVPLPMALDDDDSEAEDQTLFDINKQARLAS